VSTFLAHYGLVAVALVLFAGELGIPILIPGELALLWVGSHLNGSWIALLQTCGAFSAVDLMASILLFSASRGGGNRLLRFTLRRALKGGRRPEEVIAGWRARLDRHDSLVIFVIRTIPGIRISGSIISGAVRLPFRSFLGGAAPASAVWVSVPLIVGYGLQQRLGSVSLPGPHLVAAITSAIGITVLLGGGTWWVARQHAAQRATR
jgi:membrane protein DedA with SNARE-associated domain